MNLQEEEFKNEFEANGYTVVHSGWPDFLIMKNGVVAGVELKGKNDFVKPNQQEMMDILSAAGINCFVSYWKWHEVTNYMEMAGRQDDVLKTINQRYMRKITGIITRLKTTKRMLNILDDTLRWRRLKRKESHEIVEEIQERIDMIIEDIKMPPTNMLEQWFEEKREYY